MLKGQLCNTQMCCPVSLQGSRAQAMNSLTGKPSEPTTPKATQATLFGCWTKAQRKNKPQNPSNRYHWFCPSPTFTWYLVGVTVDIAWAQRPLPPRGTLGSPLTGLPGRTWRKHSPEGICATYEVNTSGEQRFIHKVKDLCWPNLSGSPGVLLLGKCQKSAEKTEQQKVAEVFYAGKKV